MTFRRRRAAAAVVAIAVATATATAALADKPTAKSARVATASATAYARDNGDGATPIGYVTSSGNGGQGSGRASVSTSTEKGNARATASVRVDGVSIFNGLVKADAATASAAASGDGAERTDGTVTNLVIAGKLQRTPRGRTVYDMNGYGAVVALDDSHGGIVAIRAKLTKRYRDHPAGTTVRIAFATASAQDGADPNPPAPKPHKPKPHKPKPAKPKPHKSAPQAPANGPKKPHKAKRRKPSRTHVLLTGKGFVFPVYGKHNYGDTYGAFRADTGFHEGNDIFAEAGTPLVAVCDGTLNRVGTLPISGNRLWVKCSKTGDAFFYAHLSAFATDTRNGLHVKAGQVIGFVGSTGDAEQTPPHCHFEVHPGNGPSVDPYPFLRAWESHRDVPAAAWVRANGELGQQQPGTLVVVKDFLNR